MGRSGVVLGILVAGCNVEPPGELLGEYDLRGALLENTCGVEALPANDPLLFQAQIRDDDGRALWLMMPPARPGVLEDDGDFSFETESSFQVDPDRPAQGPDPFAPDPEAFTDEASLEAFAPAGSQAGPACTLLIIERMNGTLWRDLHGVYDASDAAEDVDDETAGLDLVGENEIEIRAASGSDCRLVMSDQGGPFEALPCHALYEIDGTLIEE
ncbi:MAG: hypothetical protein OXT09_28410 [Myxococcales bacterium]|nr:hypothetical protein [Myxococcales bacterium]